MKFRGLHSELVNLVGAARHEVVLVAPFMKMQVVASVLEATPKQVRVSLFTRWNPEEVARGVSDLEVFDLVQGRPNTVLSLVNNLHAKLYIADDIGDSAV